MRYSFSKIAVVFIICSGFINMRSDSEVQKKNIRNGNYDIEFYVALKQPSKLASNKTYYWYKSGEIHQSMSSSGGLLLHSDYMKFYRSNQLAEKGHFNYGLKDGAWKLWNEEGKLKKINTWSKGILNGPFYSFDENGTVLIKGAYSKGFKSGRWVYFKSKDTLTYEKGIEKVIDSSKQDGFFNRLFRKKSKKKDTQKNLRKEQPKTKNAKDSFFKRLFKKKKKKKSSKSS